MRVPRRLLPISAQEDLNLYFSLLAGTALVQEEIEPGGRSAMSRTSHASAAITTNSSGYHLYCTMNARPSSRSITKAAVVIRWQSQQPVGPMASAMFPNRICTERTPKSAFPSSILQLAKQQTEVK